MKVFEIADTRCGDKGDISNVCVFAKNDEVWDLLRTRLTVAVVRNMYGELVKGDITRYEFTVLKGLNFVMTQALGGGVSMSLRVDPHGKSYASLMDEIELTR
jgi:hypothetical protein